MGNAGNCSGLSVFGLCSEKGPADLEIGEPKLGLPER